MTNQVRCRPQFAKWHKLLQETNSLGAFEILSLMTSCHGAEANTLLVFTTVGFPMLQFEAVKNWLMTTRNAPIAAIDYENLRDCTGQFRPLTNGYFGGAI